MFDASDIRFMDARMHACQRDEDRQALDQELRDCVAERCSVASLVIDGLDMDEVERLMCPRTR